MGSMKAIGLVGGMSWPVVPSLRIHAEAAAPVALDTLVFGGGPSLTGADT